MSNMAASPELNSYSYLDCWITQTTSNASGKILKHKPLSEVVYLEAHSKYVTAYFADGTTFLLNTPLIEFTRRFCSNFIEPTRGVLLNAAYFKGATLWGDEKMTLSMHRVASPFLVSRRKKPVIHKQLNDLNFRFSRMTSNCVL